MGRRGQANVISLLIIIAAVLSVALALYAYYVGVFSHQSAQRSLIDTLSTYTAKTRITLESYVTNTSGGEYQYCVLVSVVNNGGDTLRAYFSLLPVAPGTNVLKVDPSFNRVPVDYESPVPIRRELVWLAEDIDHNGAIDLLGSGGVEYNGSVSMPTCSTIYKDYSNDKVHGLDLPPEAQVHGLGFYANRTLTSINGPSLLEVARINGLTLPNDTAVPFWNFTLPGFGKVEFLMFMTSPVEVHELSIVGAFMDTQNGDLIIYVVNPVRG